MNGLLTDLYELTMSAGYFAAGKSAEIATFELSVRRMPPHRNFVVATGLAQAADYLLNLSFSAEEIDYLRSLRLFASSTEEFFDYLCRLRFTGDLFAVPEGTPIFAGEPVLTVRAPLIEAQVAETYLLSIIGFQTLVATKAARVVEAAAGRPVVEFGTRHAHSPEAGVLAGRAAYIGGCAGTSNTLAGFRFGIPVSGTAAHSWVMSFTDETESFRRLQQLLGPSTVYLIDSYDTIEGARKAAALGEPILGVRLDSGDLDALSRQVRGILDEAGLTRARIMATGDLNEYRIRDLVAGGAPIDSFGVGTELATSGDAPSLCDIYKMVELSSGGVKRYTAKFSAEKVTVPGAKQILRFRDHDEVAGAWECPLTSGKAAAVEALLRPVIYDGELVEPLPDVHTARERAAKCLRNLPPACRHLTDAEPYRVEWSEELTRLSEQVREQVAE
ncbi:MAG: nicotinate phosphoribosyltransferase [Acidobacteriales bacterium]|nr:nicotinate phosphoribosyltransferase [Terriglobales bacterium]